MKKDEFNKIKKEVIDSIDAKEEDLTKISEILGLPEEFEDKFSGEKDDRLETYRSKNHTLAIRKILGQSESLAELIFRVWDYGVTMGTAQTKMMAMFEKGGLNI